MAMLLTGRRIGATQALEYGLVNEVVPDDALDSAVDAWVEDIVACAPLSLRAIKRSAHDTAHLTVSQARNTRLRALPRPCRAATQTKAFSLSGRSDHRCGPGR